ncbi:short-chain collagen C4-like isoform X2 [Mya arenaria]|uniref:short-chain collagen C4-like isoform X2 n=1 Tax=Mya arenaria TaxID=6604 RepID=UPI0022DF992E|nr:short-chain collagen C4-like isoform X2 [Mya arenaria]
MSSSFGICRAEEEPICFSRYDYDRKMMKDMLIMEEKIQKLELALYKHSSVIQEHQRTIEKGSSYVSYTRWGRNDCPETSQLVYRGYAAGKHYTHKGSGSDTVCLPEDPTWSNYTDSVGDGYKAYIYGTEFDDSYTQIFPYNVNQQDVPCAVCLARKHTTLMIPGRNNCYNGWTKEYHGYLLTAYYDHSGPISHICVDFEPDFLPRGETNDNGHLLYLVEARCGSLPCPPYVNGRELACVVCTM